MRDKLVVKVVTLSRRCVSRLIATRRNYNCLFIVENTAKCIFPMHNRILNHFFFQKCFKIMSPLDNISSYIEQHICQRTARTRLKFIIVSFVCTRIYAYDWLEKRRRRFTYWHNLLTFRKQSEILEYVSGLLSESRDRRVHLRRRWLQLEAVRTTSSLSGEKMGESEKRVIAVPSIFFKPRNEIVSRRKIRNYEDTTSFFSLVLISKGISFCREDIIIKVQPLCIYQATGAHLAVLPSYNYISKMT